MTANKHSTLSNNRYTGTRTLKNELIVPNAAELAAYVAKGFQKVVGGLLWPDQSDGRVGVDPSLAEGLLPAGTQYPMDLWHALFEWPPPNFANVGFNRLDDRAFMCHLSPSVVLFEWYHRPLISREILEVDLPF